MIWKAYKKIIPPEQDKICREVSYYIEGFNATIRARLAYAVRVSKLVRKTLSF
jgi:IS1 family transposase